MLNTVPQAVSNMLIIPDIPTLNIVEHAENRALIAMLMPVISTTLAKACSISKPMKFMIIVMKL